MRPLFDMVSHNKNFYSQNLIMLPLFLIISNIDLKNKICRKREYLNNLFQINLKYKKYI